MKRSWSSYGVGAAIVTAALVVAVGGVSALRHTPQRHGVAAHVSPRIAQQDSAVTVRFRMPITLRGAAARRALLVYQIQGGTHGALPTRFVMPPLGSVFGYPRSPRTTVGCGRAESVYNSEFRGYVDWHDKEFSVLEVAPPVRRGRLFVRRIAGGLSGGWCSGEHHVLVSLIWPQSTDACAHVAQPYAECQAVRLIATGDFVVGQVRPGAPPNCQRMPSPCRGAHRGIPRSPR